MSLNLFQIFLNKQFFLQVKCSEISKLSKLLEKQTKRWDKIVFRINFLKYHFGGNILLQFF